MRSGRASGRTGAALVDEPAGGLRGDTGVAAIGVGADGGPELLLTEMSTAALLDFVRLDAAAALGE